MAEFKVRLNDSQLSFRINLGRKRLASYPLDSMDFIFVNLERPEMSKNQSYWCTGDLSGRILEALAVSEDLTGCHDGRLSDIFYRILRMKQPDGLIGRYAQCPEPKKPEELPSSGSDKMFTALLQYYFYSDDHRALAAAKDIGDYLIEHKAEWIKRYFVEGGTVGNYCWLTEPFAMLYHATKDERYRLVLEECLEKIKKMRVTGCHSHGFLTALRGFQRMAVYTGDKSWNEYPEYCRDLIINNKWENAAGDVCESLPYSRRNEACATADWMMMNLWSGYINGDDKEYAKAEHILWNAVFFNQIISGGSGHRAMTPWGYGANEFQEAWWCCTETAVLGMSELSRHAVTYDGGKLRIDFLVPGEYTYKNITVKISTAWPGKADTLITVEGCAPDDIYVRIPEGIKNVKEERAVCEGAVTIRLSGDVGHTVEKWKDDMYILKYGLLVLAPSNYTWGKAAETNDNAIPEGYLRPSFPSVNFKITPPDTNENGFYKFRHFPFPDWVYYDEGPESRTSFEGVSVSVDLNFPDGTVKAARFWPLCYNISTLTFYDIPIVFGLKE